MLNLKLSISGVKDLHAPLLSELMFTDIIMMITITEKWHLECVELL